MGHKHRRQHQVLRGGVGVREFGFRTWLRLCLGLLLAGLPASPVLAQAAGLTFTGTTRVGNSSSAVTVSMTAQVAGSAGAPQALTAGVAGLDFSLASTGTCGGNPELARGQTCTVSVVFTPRYPGLRQGAVVLRSADGLQALASTPLSGIGLGGLPVLVPGEINTVVGLAGQWVYQKDDVAATVAPVFLPTGLAVDGAGDLYLCDSSNNRVRWVDAVTGKIETLAGNGTAGSAGDGGPAQSAELNNPSGLALDGAGNLYIADSGNNVIRRVDAVSKVISTVAGQIGGSGYVGDGGPATQAFLTSPQGLALTPGGDLLIADTGDAAVRLLTFADGKIGTIAGTGAQGYNGDGVAATSAQLNNPRGVAVRSDGAVAIADFANQRVRLVDTGGAISTIAGTGARNFSGDGGPATAAALNEPAAVAFDPAGDLVIADAGNNRVRGIYGAGDGSVGTITTLAGNSSEGSSGDAGPASSATLYGPYEVVFDAGGNLWISDMFNNRVREVRGSMLGITYPTMKVGKTSVAFAGMLYNAGNSTLTLSQPVLTEAALDASTTCGQAPLGPTVFCNMGVEFAPTEVGQNVAGSIQWASDAPHVTPVDDLNGEVLSVEPTSVTLVADTNPGLLGHPIILTASVQSDNTGLGGTVSFSEGGNAWCAAVPLDGNGTASCRIPSLSLGSHVFAVNYSGDDNDAASTSQPYTEVIKQQPALALAVSTSPAVVTSNVILTLTAADQTGTPTGSVVFLDGTTAIATVTLNAQGVATWSTQTLAVGTHNLTAQYAGDGANVAGTSTATVEQIVQASTLTVLAASSTEVTVGSPIILTASVVSRNGPAPTGSVEFRDGPGTSAAVLGAAPLDENGNATITVASLAPGSHAVLAVYDGDTDDATSSSAPLATAVEQVATVTSLGADVNPLNAGAALHLTAIVSLPPGAVADGSLSGTVTFMDGVAVLGSTPINATGQAMLAVSSLGVGAHAIVASFSGSTNYAAGASTPLHETVQQTATQTTLSSASATTLAGKVASFTASVQSATGIPTGTVTFRDGNTALGSTSLNGSGVASYSTTKLTQGTHNITAVYGGDSSYEGSTSVAVQQIVALAQPTLTASGPAAAVDAGTAVTVTAVLSTAGAAPTGTLTLLDGSVVVAAEPVTGTGSFGFSTTRLGIGTHTLTVSYSGDTANAQVTSSPVNVLIQQAKSSTTLTASANPLTRADVLNLTSHVSSDSPNPGGTVSFYDGATLLGSTTLGADGAADLAISSLALGTHSLSASYAGDTNHAGSTSEALSELVVQSATATLTSSNNPAASGQHIVFTAQMGGAGTLLPTGVATFRDNGILLATVPLNGSGTASLSTTALAVGTHTVSVSYAGDTHFASIEAQLVQTVVDASTQVALVASANPATYAQPVSLTATVSSDGGAATGAVIFTDGSTSLGAAQLNADGVAVLTLATLPPGAHGIIANYAGDGKAGASVSTPLPVVVKQGTTLAVSSNSNPAATLSPVTLTVTLAAPGAAPVTGSVGFTDGAASIGTAPLDAAGRASLTLPQMSAGSHSIVAAYAGDAENFASTSPAYTQTVQLRPTSVTVTGSPTDLMDAQQITLIGVVSGQGSVSPGGSVTFTSGNVTLGVAPVDATGVATLTVIFEQQTEPIVASYSGDASYAGAQSAPSTVVAGEAPQFTLAVDVPRVKVATRQHTTLTVRVGSVKGFADTIVLGCLGLPEAATCTFDRSQLKLAADGTASATLILDTGDPLGAGSGASASLKSRDADTFLCVLPLGVLALLAGRRRRTLARRRLGTLLLFCACLATAMVVVGCSGLSTSSTPPGSYTFKVVGTGQGSGTTQAQPLTLVVTQ